MDRIIIYHHSADLDGLCSGAIAEMAMKDKAKEQPEFNVPVTMVGIDYPLSTEIEEKVMREANRALVIILDFCFSPATMRKLKDIAESLIWIDHHDSSILGVGKEMTVLNAIPGKQMVGKAACELAWEYFYHILPMIPQVQLLGMYDTFRHKKPFKEEEGFVEHVMSFQLAARTKLKSVNDFFEQGFFAGDFLVDPEYGEHWLSIGKAMNDFRMANLKKGADINGCIKSVYSEEITPESYIGDMFVINSNEFSSAVSEHLDTSIQETIVGTLVYATLPTGKIRIGLYKDHHNASQEQDFSTVAKYLGGGGHTHAAGAIITDVETITGDTIILR